MKTIVTVVLLLFVGVSLGYVVLRESGRDAATEPATPDPAAVASSGEQAPAENVHTVIAYYFHGNFRCATCTRLEAYAKEAVETGFPEAMADDVLVWKPINVEEPANEHFVKDYQLTTRSVVLSHCIDGAEIGYVNLDRIWQLAGNKDAYLAYIQEAVRTMLEDAS